MLAVICSCALLLQGLVLPAKSSTRCDLSIENVLSIFRPPTLDRGILPPGFQTTRDLILASGYDHKEYKVETEDGFILRIHRVIGKNRGRPPVLFSHGALTSSESFLMKGRKNNLVYELADEGFDVWLLDRRGNWYSREHKVHKPNTWAFWNFSFDESGYYDLPAAIDFINKISNNSPVYFIGHSMGATDFCVMASARPEYNAKVRLAALLAPVCKMAPIQEVPSPLLRLIATSMDLVYLFAKRASIYEFVAKQKNIIKMVEECCVPDKYQYLCLSLVNAVMGFTSPTVNKTELIKLVIHFPGGTSFKTMQHLLGMFKSGLVHYDYGASENLIRYQNVTPPSYPLQKVTSPVALYWGMNDPYINERTLKELEGQLPNVVENHRVEDPTFNHLDFVTMSNVKPVNKRIMKLFKRFL